MNTKIFNFAGADHKVGVTMLVQSLADAFKERYPEQKMLILHLDGNEGSDYINKNASAGSIDDLYQSFMAKVGTFAEVNELLITEKNVSTLLGSHRNNECVSYTPSVSQDLINICKDYFDVILIDSGASANWNGLAVGSLEYGCPNYLVTTQQESAFNAYAAHVNDVYINFTAGFDGIILNKFVFSGRYIKGEKETFDRYGHDGGFTIGEVEGSWQAEAEHMSLYSYDKHYKKDIDYILDALLM